MSRAQGVQDHKMSLLSRAGSEARHGELQQVYSRIVVYEYNISRSKSRTTMCHRSGKHGLIWRVMVRTSRQKWRSAGRSQFTQIYRCIEERAVCATPHEGG